MGENTKIAWTHTNHGPGHTFNPWLGCTRVSAGCVNCYAEKWAKRSGLVKWGPKEERRRTSEVNWGKPIKWQKQAATDGRRARVFCSSLADVFEDNATIDPQWRADLWALIHATPDLDWLMLTKRPENIAGMLPPNWGSGWNNVWLGTTVEDQGAAERRIPEILKIPARVRFLSVEPMVGPVDLSTFPPGISWVIVGGESGGLDAIRPMKLEWARDLRDWCQASRVPFFLKQLGSLMARDQNAPGAGDDISDFPIDLRIQQSP